MEKFPGIIEPKGLQASPLHAVSGRRLRVRGRSYLVLNDIEEIF